MSKTLRAKILTFIWDTTFLYRQTCSVKLLKSYLLETNPALIQLMPVGGVETTSG